MNTNVANVTMISSNVTALIPSIATVNLPVSTEISDLISLAPLTEQAIIYLGCFFDNKLKRDLNGSSNTDNSMTVKMCLEYCSVKNYSYAGLSLKYLIFEIF